MAKRKYIPKLFISLTLSLIFINTVSCSSNESKNSLQAVDDFNRYSIYSSFELKSSMDSFSKEQKQMVVLLIEASDIMDDLFWKQTFSEDKRSFLTKIDSDRLRKFANMNYGPWDRLDGDKPFLKGFGEKSQGAQFYPKDMTKAEFEKAKIKNKRGLYSLVVRDQGGELKTVPYSVAYKEELENAAKLLEKASTLAQDKGFRKYLKLRAKALRSNKYKESDLAWMDMKNNSIDVVIGPIESYEDQLFGYRAAFEAYVLIKDKKWSKRLAKYAKYLPELQKSLPVPLKYKREVPGTSADLNAYDVVYYAGHSKAGAKTIAINLPNDESVQLKKGTRRLQLKNMMRAKFEKILLPIAQEVIDPTQLQYVTFDAFFANTMFHEIAHGLGIKKTINGKGMVRTALKELSSSIEEGKADTLGIHMIGQLFNKGVLTEGRIENHYVTFLAGAFRSMRFGASSAHAKADMVRFNFFKEMGAFTRDQKGRYKVDFMKMKKAIKELSKLILTIQGDGDYVRLQKLMKKSGNIGLQTAVDLERIRKANIPVDIQVIQGKAVLGL